MTTKSKTNPNNYTGSDSERIAKAVTAAADHGGIVHIPRRKANADSNRDYWLIDEAILLPADTTLILENSTIKLSDASRDNFVRSANCGQGIATVKPVENIHLLGIGNAQFVGADHPRATGDSAKTLGVRTYGTDAGKAGCKQTGDWRNIGILMANVAHFSIRGITVRNAHCWAISLEQCSFGTIREITFFAETNAVIDGKPERILNRDGLDLRRGCHDISIDTVTGYTGDDSVALTALAVHERPAGILESTEVMGVVPGDPSNDIYNVTIRNVLSCSRGCDHIVRFLNASGVKMHHILLDGVVDTSPDGVCAHAAVRIGDQQPAWGGVAPLGTAYAFQVRNITSKARQAVLIDGSLTDSVISGVMNLNADGSPVAYGSGIENTRNLVVK